MFATAAVVGGDAEGVSARFRALTSCAGRRFARLRSLAPHRDATPSYLAAFDAYGEVWRFQQLHRAQLEAAGLQRWEVGELASKIGQLYYNIYLRTSESRFLLESFTFYDAIRTRGYFRAARADAKVAAKQLRFYARFVVVCLLLNRHSLVQELLKELENLSKELPDGTDAHEWSSVVEEIRRFLWADDVHALPRASAPRSMRAQPAAFGGALPGGAAGCRVRSAILVSYQDQQVKFSTLTLDMHRMLQALEWECEAGADDEWLAEIEAASGVAAAESATPAALKAMPMTLPTPPPTVGGADENGELEQSSSTSGDTELDAEGGSSGGGGAPTEPSTPTQQPQQPQQQRDCADGDGAGAHPLGGQGGALANPVKYLMFCPRVTQLLQVLAASVDEMPDDSVLLFYLSARGVSTEGGGGAAAPEQQLIGAGEFVPTLAGGQPVGLKDASRQLYPSDLLPFTRRPMLVVVDSDRVDGFAALGGAGRGGPVGVLVSPAAQGSKDWASESGHPDTRGGLFTLFLTGPLHALVAMTGGRSKPSAKACAAAAAALEAVLTEWGDVLRARGQAGVWATFAADPHAFRIIMRFVLCRAAFCLHVDQRSRRRGRVDTPPGCSPSMPPELLPDNQLVREGVLRVVKELGVGYAYDCSPLPPKAKPPSSAHYQNGKHAHHHGGGHQRRGGHGGGHPSQYGARGPLQLPPSGQLHKQRSGQPRYAQIIAPPRPYPMPSYSNYAEPPLPRGAPTSGAPHARGVMPPPSYPPPSRSL